MINIIFECSIKFQFPIDIFIIKQLCNDRGMEQQYK